MICNREFFYADMEHSILCHGEYQENRIVYPLKGLFRFKEGKWHCIDGPSYVVEGVGACWHLEGRLVYKFNSEGVGTSGKIYSNISKVLKNSIIRYKLENGV